VQNTHKKSESHTLHDTFNVVFYQKNMLSIATRQWTESQSLSFAILRDPCPAKKSHNFLKNLNGQDALHFHLQFHFRLPWKIRIFVRGQGTGKL